MKLREKGICPAGFELLYITVIHLAARRPKPALEFVFVGPLAESEVLYWDKK